MRTTILVLVALAAVSFTVRIGTHVRHRAAVRAAQGKAPAVKVGRDKAAPVKDEKAKPPAPPKVEPDNGVNWRQDVEGYGRSRNEAVEDALEKAAGKVKAFLREQKPAVAWSPSAAWVREHLADVEQAKRLDDVDLGGAVGKVQCWSVRVSITPSRYREIVREDREYRAQQEKANREVRSGERMLLLGKVLAGLLVLLLGVVGYIRLDDVTKGAYTRWLRVGLGGVFAVACAVLLLFG
jgi:hypothetical protein